MKKLKLEKIAKNGCCVEFETPNARYPEDPVDFVIRELMKYNEDEEDIDNIRFSTGEMLANAIEYGNRFDSEKKVSIYCARIKNRFYVVVKDEGEGFDIKNPVYRSMSPPEGSLGIDCVRSRVNGLYNFKDSASYFCIELN